MKFSMKQMSFVLATGIFALAACNGNSSSSTASSDSTASAMSTSTTVASPDTMNNTSKMASNSDQDLVNFLVTGNTKEIAWINAALANSSNKEVKAHAKMMLKDHIKLGNDVKDYASKKNMTTPTVDTTNAVTINDKSGKDWDIAWVNKMVDDHSDLLDHLNNANVKDADLKSIVDGAKPVVQSHLDMVKGLQTKMASK